jgi:membrane-bound metal-dependent hydrolase YbcI (DUF457 family)
MGAWSVLRDSNFDYRLIALAALLPDVIDAAAGHRAIAHTLVFAVGELALVMAMTTNRRPIRKRLLAVPIGLFAHLVLDGVWGVKELFWWPAFGSWGNHAIVPALPIVVIREVIGIAFAVVIVQRFGLRDAQRRREFFQTGRLVPC